MKNAPAGAFFYSGLKKSGAVLVHLAVPITMLE